MTPLEKARKRQGEVMCCLECENVEKVGGAWYCKISGKMQHPYRLVNTGVPIKCDNARRIEVMTERAEIERLLSMTGRTLEELPKQYSIQEIYAAGRSHGVPPAEAGKTILHQSDVIELLIGALRDALDKQPKWISVEDRLPEDKKETADCYLVTDGDFIWMAYYACKEWQFAQCTDSPYVINWTDITHWMPLPEPPKEDV